MKAINSCISLRFFGDDKEMIVSILAGSTYNPSLQTIRLNNACEVTAKIDFFELRLKLYFQYLWMQFFKCSKYFTWVLYKQKSSKKTCMQLFRYSIKACIIILWSIVGVFCKLKGITQ